LPSTISSINHHSLLPFTVSMSRRRRNLHYRAAVTTTATSISVKTKAPLPTKVVNPARNPHTTRQTRIHNT
jgi:hypothetical protein